MWGNSTKIKCSECGAEYGVTVELQVSEDGASGWDVEPLRKCQQAGGQGVLSLSCRAAGLIG